MTFHKIWTTGLAAGLVLAPLAWQASAQQTVTNNNQMTHDAATTRFVKQAAEGGIAEVELGNLAKDKASSQQVKDFAARMVQDHSKANDQLKSIAATQGITLPAAMSAKDQALKDRLNSLSGADFDRAYMEAMVRDHKHDVSEFQKEANSGKDNEVKNFASSTLPTLQEHLRMAEDTLNQVKTGGKGSASREMNHNNNNGTK